MWGRAQPSISYSAQRRQVICNQEIDLTHVWILISLFSKVRVSETPGKTKHFQTLVLEDDITLCDCPGLVMPSICNSKVGMVLQGILPIDQLRDHVPVITLLLTYIPPHVLESKYGLVLPREDGVHAQLSSELLLGAYGTLRGFMTSGGRPDQVRFLVLVSTKT